MIEISLQFDTDGCRYVFVESDKTKFSYKLSDTLYPSCVLDEKQVKALINMLLDVYDDIEKVTNEYP